MRWMNMGHRFERRDQADEHMKLPLAYCIYICCFNILIYLCDFFAVLF